MIFNEKQEKPEKTQVKPMFFNEKQEKPEKTQVFVILLDSYKRSIRICLRLSQTVAPSLIIGNRLQINQRRLGAVSGKETALRQPRAVSRIAIGSEGATVGDSLKQFLIDLL